MVGAEHQNTGKISNMNKSGGTFGGHIGSTIWQSSYCWLSLETTQFVGGIRQFEGRAIFEGALLIMDGG